MWAAEFGKGVNGKSPVAEKKTRDERSTRLAYPQADLLKEQSQPRHDDLNAGIWIETVRRAPAFSL